MDVLAHETEAESAVRVANHSVVATSAKSADAPCAQEIHFATSSGGKVLYVTTVQQFVASQRIYLCSYDSLYIYLCTHAGCAVRRGADEPSLSVRPGGGGSCKG